MATMSQIVTKGKGRASRRTGKPAHKNAPTDQTALLEMTELATEMNRLLDGMHEDMQEIIRDMRAMRGATNQ